MTDTVLLIALFGVAYLSFALFALSQARYWRQLTNAAPLSSSQVRLLRGLGGAGLMLSLVFALLRDGPGLGSLLWLTALSVAAIMLGLTLRK